MDPADLAFSGIARQAELIRAGEVSSRQLVELSLQRIHRIDQHLNAFRSVYDERALAEADQADGRRGAGGERPLLGVPIAIKDDTDVAGDVTTRGTAAYDGLAPADGEYVRRLRAAGAVIVGKTNVPELTIAPFTETPTFGATRNPWDLDRTPGGSSGGSAAAVAAGLVGAASASDGGGSIRIPAGCCGLFGLKPQRDRVPLAPRAEGWQGLSVFGAVTRTVADTALWLDVVKDSGPGFADAARAEPGRLRVAVSLKVPLPILAKLDAEQRGVVEATAELLRSLGHEVIERDPDYGAVVGNFMARYLRGINDDAREMPRPERLARRTKGYARMGATIPRPLLERARAAEASDAERINRVFDGVDLLMTPMFTRRPVPIGEWEGQGAPRTLDGTARFVPYCAGWNHIGQPAMSMPAGFTEDGFPLAVQFLAPADGEPLLLSLASQIEAARPWADRRPAIAA